MHTVLQLPLKYLQCNAFAVKETSLGTLASVIAASLNALVVTSKDHCTVCYELHSIMKEMANEVNEFCI
jgi:hypothetical protein